MQKRRTILSRVQRAEIEGILETADFCWQTYYAIGEKYGVSPNTIQKIKNRKFGPNKNFESIASISVDESRISKQDSKSEAQRKVDRSYQFKQQISRENSDRKQQEQTEKGNVSLNQIENKQYLQSHAMNHFEKLENLKESFENLYQEIINILSQKQLAADQINIQGTQKVQQGFQEKQEKFTQTETQDIMSKQHKDSLIMHQVMQIQANEIAQLKSDRGLLIHNKQEAKQKKELVLERQITNVALPKDIVLLQVQNKVSLQNIYDQFYSLILFFIFSNSITVE